MGNGLDDIGIGIGAIALWLISLFVLALCWNYIYGRWIKDRCCPRQRPVDDIPAMQPLAPPTIVQHVPPSEMQQNYLPQQPNIQFSPQPYNQYYPQMPPMPQHNYYPPPPTGPLPPIPHH